MKGVELPINVLIIVAVALVVLLAVIAIYFSGFNPFSSAMNIESVKNEACRRLVQQARCGVAPTGVDITDLDFSYGTNDIDTLNDYCVYVLSPPLSSGDCKKMCGCP